MRKYHIHFYQTIDVEAKNEDDAKEFGINLWNDNPDAHDTNNMEIEVEELND